MIDRLIAAARTSEFWIVVFQAVVEFANSPIPDEYKAMGWAYVAFRVLSKVVKYLVPDPQGGNT